MVGLRFKRFKVVKVEGSFEGPDGFESGQTVVTFRKAIISDWIQTPT
jgi:hypothetical protein